MFKEGIKRIIVKHKNFGKHIKLGGKTNISPRARFGGYNAIGNDTTFVGNIGFASYIGNNCFINADIGKYTCISNRIITIRGSHPTRGWVSIHPAFYSTQKQCGMTYVSENQYNELNTRLTIGNDVWIGDSVLLLDGLSIGDGAIIGAGSLVVKNVPPYAIVAGVPAQIIRYRFDDEIIKSLLELKWWDKDESWIAENAKYFNSFENISKMTKQIGE